MAVSLIAINVFAAVAQRLSFRKAAEDLALTQSAVSRHVQGLEQSLGVLLFIRHGRTISLTPQGQALFEEVNDVDFIPQPQSYPLGTLVAHPISFEIETIGYPARKAKLTKDTMHLLKRRIADRLHQVGVDIPLHESALLIWLKYVDKDGLHV